MKKVKLIYPYPNFPISRQCKDWNPNWGNFFPAVWGNYQFFINDNTVDYDFLVVFNFLLNDEICSCPVENRIFLTAEPKTIQKYNDTFLEQFGHVITCQRDIKHKNKHYYHQGHNWFVGKNFDELINNTLIKKTKNISVIISDKQFTDGHKRRYDFVMKLKEYFGSDIDLYGRGINDFQDKWDVLEPYKYSIAIENHVEDDWLTEKIYDCYLAHTLPIYYGCSNIEKYFKKSSFELIDLNDLKSSIVSIENILTAPNYYENKLDSIIEAKIHYLNELNIFPLIVNYINTINVDPKMSLKTTIIQKESHFIKKKSNLSSIKNNIKNVLKF